MAKFPSRSWGIILQQAWNLQLRDKIRGERGGTHASTLGGHQHGSSPKGFNPHDFCKRFNRGRCTFGQTCSYEHRCLYCGKFGHGVVRCHQLKADGANESRYDRYDRHDKYNRRDRQYHNDKSYNDKKHHHKRSDDKSNPK